MISEDQYKILYEKAAVVCHIENEQKHVLEKKNASLIKTIENLIDIQIAESECYAVIGKYGINGPTEARMRCLSCDEMDLKPVYIYCPNCGRKFKS